jgi:hypothetical protein
MNVQIQIFQTQIVLFDNLTRLFKFANVKFEFVHS